MKSIKTKITLIVCLLVAVSLIIVGGTVSVLMYSSSISSLETTMAETAGVASQFVYEYLATYKTVANETGLVARLSNPEITLAEKTKIIDTKVAQYEFVSGNVVGLNGTGVITPVNVADRDYFKEALKGNTVISNVMLDKDINQYVVVVAAPLWKDGIQNTSVAGVVYFNIDAKKLSDITNTIQIGKTGSAYIIDKDNYTIAHKNIDLVLNRDNTLDALSGDPSLQQLADIEAKMRAGETGFDIYKYNGLSKLIAYAPIATGQGWSLAVNAELNEFIQSTLTAIIITLILVLVAIIVGAVLSVLLANSITRPVIQIKDAAGRMAKGDFDIDITYQSKDEVGALAGSMREMIVSTKSIILDTSRGLGEIANGNFNISPKADYVGVFSGIRDSMARIIVQLSETMRDIRMAAEQVSSGSEQVSSGAQALAQGATEQASSMEELSASISEVSTQINKNAVNAESANELAGQVGANINTSNEQMTNMMGAMNEISSSSTEIGKIIKTIEDIAFQTNILALNAAVEAARAGAAGKGFAVVADEVRNLASKSAEAAKQTNVLIEGSVKSVQNGVKIARETASSLAEVVTGAVQITDLIGQITEASSEQATSIIQINQGMEQISSVVQTNSATSEESAAASEELSGQANLMKTLIEKFELNDKGVENIITIQ